MNVDELKRILKVNDWTETSPGAQSSFRAQRLHQQTFIETIDLNSKTLTIEAIANDLSNESRSLNLIGGILKQNSSFIGQYVASHTFGKFAKLKSGFQAMKIARTLGQHIEAGASIGRTKLTKSFEEPPDQYIQQDSRNVAERYYSLLEAIEKLI